MAPIIVDTGVANLASVRFAFERLGFDIAITDNVENIVKASHVIIPGVGAAPRAMDIIAAKGLIPVLQSLTQPVMGICLGMQLIFETLHEGKLKGSENIKGLGLVPGEVTLLDTKGAPSPHMGWNRLKIERNDPLLAGISTGDYAYFVHSYAAPRADYTLASANYGHRFSAVIKHKNIYGCQFHPERSSQIGAKILANFLGVDA